MSAPVGRWMLVAASVLVVGTLAAAFMTMQSPGDVRAQRLDQGRTRDLDQLSGAIERWHREHGALPASLVEVGAQPGVSLPARDPVTGAAYAYERASTLDYRLCAVFTTDTAKRDPRRDTYRHFDERWPHPAGRHCFDRKIEAPPKASVEP